MPSCNPKNPCANGYPDASCVIYTGVSIPCLGIFTNDRLDTVIQKIADAVCATPVTTTTTTTTTTAAPVLAIWGWSATPPSADSDLVEAQGSGSFTHNADITADFRANSTPQYLFMAEPLTEAIKTTWYGNDLNQGAIGIGETFSSPVTIGNKRVYITSFATQQTGTTIQFRK